MTVESTTQMLLLLFFTVLAVFGGDNAVAQDTPSIIITPFIAGGEETDIRIYPFIVSIQHKMHHKCGGVIVNKNVVLTAAHCIRSSSHDMAADTNEWEVIAGRSNLLNNKEGQRLKVQSTKTHPDYTYNRTVLLNDIGLIWLKRRFVWSDSVQPANLSQTWNIDVRPFVSYFASYVVTTIGWGRLQDSGPLPGLLQHVNQTINIGDGDNCFDTLQSEDIRSSYGSIMFCTSDKGKDACEGDSGGPVVYNDEVVGIVSHGYGGKGCEIDIGWKIKVSTYYSWIKEELKRGPSTEKKRIFCYYGSFVRKLDIEDIDPFLCTDIIYAFAGLDSNNRVFSLNKDIDLYDSGGKGGFKRFTSLKESNPLLKTWISIGGWEEGSLKYSKMVSETTSRAVFIESVVVFLQKYGFDGVDIHWLYPGMRGGLSTDRIFFVLLLRELRGSLDEHGLLLSVAVGSAKTQVPIAYNIPEISSSVHYIVLLTHSYHGDWENFTGINAPLYPQETDKSEVDLYDNVNWTVNHWIAHKAEREKLIIGIATFGRNWILEDPMDHSVGSKASKSSVTNGFMSYSEICLKVLNGWQEVNDNFTKSPYAFFENQWVSYDNPWSVGIKSNFINELELGGAAVWSLENDDFLNLCGNGKSPLTNTIKQILGAVFKGPSAEKKRIFCYYGSWSLYRHYYGKLDIENIDPFLCTDIIYAFAGLDSNNRVFSLNKDIDLYDSGGKGGFKRFTSLKESNPLLKTWLSIGGWEEGSSKYSKMASEGELRAKFIASVFEFLQKYDFDGVDIHWLYPGWRGGSSSDKANLVLLLRELRESLDRNGLLLSIAVGAKKEETDIAYDIAEISRSVHYVILLTHSYHGHWEKFTGFNAPLYPQSNSTSEFSYYNTIIWTVHHWIANKAEKRKLILGIAAFGRSWILEDPADHSVGSNAISGGSPGIFSDEFGLLSYTEICINIKNGWEEIQDNYTKSPYAFLGNRWVSYDNVWSVRLKSDLINKSVLGGAAIWSLENDDFLNFCGGGKNPLIQTVKDTLGVL